MRNYRFFQTLLVLFLQLCFFSAAQAQLEVNPSSQYCVCNNDQSSNGAGDGTFSESLIFNGPCGLNVFTGSGSSPAILASLPLTVTGPDPLTGLCEYSISFNHQDGVGYDICLTDAMGNPITGSGSGMPICVSNVCVYPEINEPFFGPLCDTDDAIDNLDAIITEINGYSGVTTVTVNGNSNNTFDPVLLGPGTHTVLWTFTGSGTGAWSGPMTGSGVGAPGGTVMNPGFPGCTTSYSLDVDVYDTPQLVVSSCNCDFDPNTGNIGSQVDFVITGGSGTYSVTSNTGLLSDANPTAGVSETLYLGPGGGSFTITVDDANGCSTSYSSACGDCYFDLNITDPCVCKNNQSYNGSGDGTFGEIIDIYGPSGLDLFIGTGSTGLIGYPVGSPIPEVLPGTYRVSFEHTDIMGYTIFVEAEVAGINVPVLDITGAQLTISNVCQYPVITEPQLDITDFCFNDTPLVFSGNEVSEINGFNGFVQVYLGGVTTGTLITEFDPSLYPNGIYELVFLFIGDFVDNVTNGVDPAFPGCQTSTKVQVGVGGGGALACNNHVNVSLDNNCEANFSWYTLLEGDYFPNVFEAEFTDNAGNIIEETDLPLHVGTTINYSIFDICNGNSCWGTMSIEDKSIPELDCDCPVGGEDLDNDGFVDGYSEECTRSCYELPLIKEQYWDNLRDDIISEDIGDFIDDHVSSVCDDVTEADISFYDVFEDLECGGALLRRTWTVSYDKGNGYAGSVSCTQEYYFEPLDITQAQIATVDPATGNFEPVENRLILPVDIIEMDCGTDISPESIAQFFDDPETEDKDTDADRIDPDELDIDLVIENNEGIPYAYPHYYIKGRNPSGPHAQAINNDICNIIVAYTDTEVEACAPGCGGNQKVLRKWTILDWCAGEFINHEQIIKAVDQNGPTIGVPSVFASVDPWKCSADVDLPQPDHLYDDCMGEVHYWIGKVDGALLVSGNAEDGFVLHDAPQGITRVEYVAEDCCGNQSNTFIEIEVSDITPPVPVTKEFIVVSLTNIGNPVDGPQGIAKVFAFDLDNGSYDGCSGIELAVRKTQNVCSEEDTLWREYVKFCCEDLNGLKYVEIDVEFRVTDENGNSNYGWSSVRLEDKSSPTQTCPVDLILTCDMDYNDFTITGLPQAFGACGEINLECDINDLIEDTEPRRKGPNDGFFNDPRYDGVEVPAYDPSCGYGAVRRQFKSCSSCTQWFVIEPVDPFDPSTIKFPEDIVVDCDAFETGEPEWENSVCNLIGVSLESDTFLFEDGACFKILNHWSVINWCIYDPLNPSAGGKYEYTQVVKIIDTQDPVVTAADSLYFEVDANCVSAIGALTARANDEGQCGSKWIKWELTVDLNADWTADYLMSSAFPRLVNGEANPYYIEPTGNDDLALVQLPIGIPSSKKWHRAVWRAYDGCGNNTSVVKYFQVTDKKAPTPYCLNISTAAMSGNGQVELWAIDFNVGSFDNCTNEENLVYTFTDVAPPGRNDAEYDSSSDLQWYDGTFWYYDPETGVYMDQDDYYDLDAHRFEPGLGSAGKIFKSSDVDASGHMSIPIYAWDECGNKDYCIVIVRIVDNNGAGEGSIAGRVATEDNRPVEEIVTTIYSNLPEYPQNVKTDQLGLFGFDNLPFDYDYQLISSTYENYLNGVSTLDLLLIQRHILGISSLDSPYKMIAADINNDKEISSIDLIELRKLILGIYHRLPENPSWKGIDAHQELDRNNPWSYRDFLNINDFEATIIDADFVAVKVGDVNQSSKTNDLNGSGNSEQFKLMNVLYENRAVKAGEIFEIRLQSVADDIYGYQFAMDLTGLELIDIIGPGIDEGSYAVVNNSLGLSVTPVKAITAGETICKITFKAGSKGLISEYVNFNPKIAKAEAYIGKNLDVVNLHLSDEQNDDPEFRLYQNQPNPFKEYTDIRFVLEKDEQVQLILTDVSGRVNSTVKIDGKKGMNEFRLNRSYFNLNGSGMLYYKLITEKHSEVKHMILIE